MQAKAEAKEKKSLIPVPEGCFNLLPCSALAFASAFSLYEFIVLDLKTFAQKTKIELVILYMSMLLLNFIYFLIGKTFFILCEQICFRIVTNNKIKSFLLNKRIK